MISTITKVGLWILAIVGGIIIVKKVFPNAIPKQLMPGSGTKTKDKNDKQLQSPIQLVSCQSGDSPSGKFQPKSGFQSSPFFRWCYLVRSGDSAGLISERITGDSARYTEILVANPNVPKKGKMGEVTGDNAWDFADGALNEGTKIFVPQTMNGWVDQFGKTKGGYFPFAVDSRLIIDEDSGDDSEPDQSTNAKVIAEVQGDDDPSFSDGFDYAGES